MAKNETKKFTEDNFIFIKLSVTELPTFSIDKNAKIIKWGKDNSFPTEILKLYKSNPIHGSIVKGKARYLSGLSIKPENDSPIVQDFLKRANKKESWYQLGKKCNPDKVLYGGFAIVITTNIAGQPLSFKHIDMGKLRITDDRKGVEYSDEWGTKKHHSAIKKTYYPFYEDGYIGESILYYKDHSPSICSIEDAYPESEYTSVILDISTAIEISKYFNSLVKNGFSAGHVITFFSGEISPTAKQEIKDRFESQHQGAENAGKVAICFVGKDGKGVEIANVDSNNLDKQYQELGSALLQNIITGHNVSGVLFKIKKDGSQLGNDRNEIDLAYQLFINEYAKPEQEPFNNIVQKFCLIKTGVNTKFFTEQFNPINKELPLDNQIVKDALDKIDPNIYVNYIMEHFGLKKPEGVQALPAPTQVQESAANEHIKNLTAYQRNGMLSVVKKFNDGKMTKEQALIMIKGFGISEDDAVLFLGIKPETIPGEQLAVKQMVLKMSSEEKVNLFLTWAEHNIVEVGDDMELVSSEQIEFKNRDEAVRFELSNQIKVGLAEEEPKKDKAGFSDFISKIFDRKKTKDVSSGEGTYENVVTTLYKYALRKGITGPLLLDNSHDFCIKMVALTSGKKRLTFEKIDSFTNDFGENAWDFRGGWYGKSPICRHVFEGETYIKRKTV
jgi:hypothetical protein